MPLTAHSLVQITVSFDNFERLARQMKKRNFESRMLKKMFAFGGEIKIVDNIYLSLGAKLHVHLNFFKAELYQTGANE